MNLVRVLAKASRPQGFLRGVVVSVDPSTMTGVVTLNGSDVPVFLTDSSVTAVPGSCAYLSRVGQTLLMVASQTFPATT